MADRAVLGLFESVDTAAAATGQLLENGFTGRDFDILSSSPFPHGAFGEADPQHNLYVFPIIGALSGLIMGILVTAGTQIANPLVTGGKPILSIPPMLVIMYEGTMLGALIFTVLGVLFESRLPSAGPRVYDTRITEGYIGVVVSGTQDQVESAARIMNSAGADGLKMDGDEEEYVVDGEPVREPVGTEPYDTSTTDDDDEEQR
jgi:hypothetical protein